MSKPTEKDVEKAQKAIGWDINHCLDPVGLEDRIAQLLADSREEHAKLAEEVKEHNPGDIAAQITCSVIADIIRESNQ